jgi:hypothetical protein
VSEVVCAYDCQPYHALNLKDINFCNNFDLLHDFLVSVMNF